MLSILIPTLNEERALPDCLRRVREVAPAAEIIVSDGGSSDRTLSLAAPYARVVEGPSGRGRQLNRAAAHARGERLLFLHADTLLPWLNVEEEIARGMERPGILGGNFRIQFFPTDPAVRFLERMYNAARPIGLFFGDSAMFVRREPFLARGGFHREDLMEDVELARWMRRAGRTFRIEQPVRTSSRRFRGSAFRHVALWLSLYSLFYCGVPDRALARFYPAVR
ncbi:MAG TPA: TIGR04283 family arsenosugar biosynthesis glycosyltransferase [Armatimonadota bacterium]|nr:TIGR04283 family arsenosugar biosynthesis glycosyltransferase [Armatimonadota bacterium]